VGEVDCGSKVFLQVFLNTEGHTEALPPPIRVFSAY